MDASIESVLNEVVRPILEAHGGGIGDYSFRDGVFRFCFTGECAQCPSAWISAEQIVAENLMAQLPEVKAVFLEQGVSQDLRRQALDILERRNGRRHTSEKK